MVSKAEDILGIPGSIQKLDEEFLKRLKARSALYDASKPALEIPFQYNIGKVKEGVNVKSELFNIRPVLNSGQPSSGLLSACFMGDIDKVKHDIF
jgi:hypothetical protein